MAVRAEWILFSMAYHTIDQKEIRVMLRCTPSDKTAMHYRKCNSRTTKKIDRRRGSTVTMMTQLMWLVHFAAPLCSQIENYYNIWIMRRVCKSTGAFYPHRLCHFVDSGFCIGFACTTFPFKHVRTLCILTMRTDRYNVMRARVWSFALCLHGAIPRM